MSFVTLGVVSNAWSDLLPATSLRAQCERAAAAGYGCVELRQRGLAECEERREADERPWPLPERLADLAAALPGIGFNLAVEAPFLTTRVDPRDPYLERCAAAARALGGSPPVLRLVDLSPAPALLDHEEAIDELGQSAAELAAHLWRGGVRLALENSRQPVGALRAVIRRAAFGLAESVPVPQLCWDPMNQIQQRLYPEDPVETARSLAPEELFEFHFKQGRERALLPDVTGPGDLDWPALLSALRERGYRGPALFEIPAGPAIWERLEASTAYIRSLLGAG